MKRSEIRDLPSAGKVFPDFAALHPGYGLQKYLRQTAAFIDGFITKN